MAGMEIHETGAITIDPGRQRPEAHATAGDTDTPTRSKRLDLNAVPSRVAAMIWPSHIYLAICVDGGDGRRVVWSNVDIEHLGGAATSFRAGRLPEVLPVVPAPLTRQATSSDHS